MIAALLSSKLGLWLAGAFAALVALIGVYFKGRSDKQADTTVKAAKQQAKVVQQVNEVKDEIDSTSDTDLRKRAAAEWVRK